jgi:hypothetical protein
MNMAVTTISAPKLAYADTIIGAKNSTVALGIHRKG